ncbi:hypothetical protein ACV229_32320 [Burkholderia sp. MR1-5-21]
MQHLTFTPLAAGIAAALLGGCAAAPYDTSSMSPCDHEYMIANPAGAEYYCGYGYPLYEGGYLGFVDIDRFHRHHHDHDHDRDHDRDHDHDHDHDHDFDFRLGHAHPGGMTAGHGHSVAHAAGHGGGHGSGGSSGSSASSGFGSDFQPSGASGSHGGGMHK